MLTSRQQFSGRSVAAMEPMMDELILGWLDTLRKNFMEPQRSFDIGQKMQYLSVDVISRLCFGKEIGCVKNDRDMHHILETVEVGNKACQYFSVFLELNTLFFGLSKIPMLRNIIFPTPTDKNGVGRMMGVSSISTVIIIRILLLNAFPRGIDRT